MAEPKIGQTVQININGHWLPFMLTHVMDADIVSGVAFSGRPREHGWNRCCGDFANVIRGEGHRNWRPDPADRAKPRRSK